MKRPILTVTAILAAMLAIACGPGAADRAPEPSSDSTPAVTSGQVPAAAQVPKQGQPQGQATTIDLVFAHPYVGSAAEALESAVRMFDESRTDLTVTIRRMTFETALDDIDGDIRTGSGPDVFVAPDTYAREWMTHGSILQPIDGLLKKADPTLIPSDMWQQRFTDRLTSGGLLQGLPLAVRVPILVVNPDVVHDGFRFRTDSTAGDPASALAFHNADWLVLTGFPPAFGGTVIDGTGTPAFGSDQAISAFRFLAGQIRAGGMIPVADRLDVVEMFNQARVDAVLVWPDAASMISPSRAWTVVPIPRAESNSPGAAPVAPWWQVDCLFHSSWSRHRDESADLMAWLVADQQQEFLMRQDFPGLITRKAPLPPEYEKSRLMTGVRAQYNMSIPSPDLPAVATAAKIFGQAVNDIVKTAGSGADDVATKLRAAQGAAVAAVTKVMQSSSVRLK